MSEKTVQATPAVAASQASWRCVQARDRDGWLALMADDVVVEDPIGEAVTNPDGRGVRGKAGVGEFFASLGAIEMHDFQVHNFLGGGNQVVASITIELTVKATGKRLRDEELHLWTFDDAGKVIAMRHYVDTAKHLRANTP